MIPKIYNPKLIESKWQDEWQKSNCFAYQNQASHKAKPNFCIMLPPPNVTGNLHMGHAFQHTMIDLLIRLKRMQGYNVLWQAGLDHAGISTQIVVERQLALQGIKRTNLKKEDFIAKVWEWKEQHGDIIVNQMKRFGTAIDWSIARFTLDQDFSYAVRKIFVELYREGLIYKGKKLINWDPILQTAISDLEVITEELPGNLWYIKYPLIDVAGEVTIATTRPETLLGDVAIGVNPLDHRYTALIGKKVKVPIVARIIPIIADPYVDPNFGSGCLKITPAHDRNDYNLALKHNLPLINIFSKDLTLNDNVPIEFRGLNQVAARDLIVTVLAQQNLLLKTEDCMINLPKSASTNAIVEPLLTDQWLLNMESLAQPALAAVKNGSLKFVPPEWTNNYVEWLNNIEDWCISRQLWWGHQIPAWYDNSGKVYVGEDLAAVRKFYEINADEVLVQDQDVLDTWFSSALWPFVTLGWPKDLSNFNQFFPTNLLITGFDIIFFWVARMVMLSLKFTGQIPFKTVYIHGIIQDHEGKKMSKSKGNVIDPIDLIDGITASDLIAKRTRGLMQPEQQQIIAAKTKQQFPDGINCYGTDALRFTFCAIATNNRHIKFDLLRLEGYRNFCNKLWNAARFVLLHWGEAKFSLAEVDYTCFQRSIPTQWILSKWQQVKVEFIEHIDNYRFDLAAKLSYDFVWNEYCDWYLEFAKVTLFDKSAELAQVNEVKLGLVVLLDEILKVLHPLMPYITEEIWHSLAHTIKLSDHAVNLLIQQNYPKYDQGYVNLAAEQGIDWVKKFIMAIRAVKSSLNLPVGTKLPEVLVDHSLSAMELQYLNQHEAIIKVLAKIECIKLTHHLAKHKGAVIVLVHNTEIGVIVQDLIDITAEKNRLTKEIAKLQQLLERSNHKLHDPNYLNNAPHEVIAKEQQKQIDLQISLEKLTKNLKTLD